MSSITPDQLKVLEQTRQRLVQLTQSLASLINNINQSDPLPAWSSLQSQATIISNNLLTVSQQLTDHETLLSSLVAYPTPQFPGHSEAAMLSQLLRTKLEPRVEDWVSRGRSLGNTATNTQQQKNLTAAQLTELWHWAPVEANMEARRRNWGGDYTLEEREAGVKSVVTGLRRRLVEDSGSESGSEEESEEEEDAGQMEGVGAQRRADGAGALSGAPVGGPAVPMGDMFRFMMTGQGGRGR
ncbi:mediator of RNA polymerase II transcription subunit 8 [Onygenales sp. PD_40]|nr:mediator of RNA polymerase II transcription subunit 8 [Onygenales sp. PD_40]KAK2779968.1 mediator of RNA polymerase II transcription subunit 8 [Emmonsiellopsis sp. PD_33]KAK2795819.1 mediator of RNA polymerase II transcription subunit 8 [Onygenales sp. PD_12]